MPEYQLIGRMTNTTSGKPAHRLPASQDKISNAGVAPTPNKAIRGDHGGLFLHGRKIYINRALNIWKFRDNNSVIADDEFWHPQKADRPPNNAYFHVPTETYY